MVDPPEDRRPPLTPQLALRVAIVGSVALALFAIIFFRLWFLQVLSGDQYVRAATVNRVRKLAIASPRGNVLDRSGAVLVDSNRALAVDISPPDLPVPVSLADIATIEHPPKRDAVVYNRLAHVLGMPTARRRCELHMKKPNVFRLSPIACLVGQQVTLVAYSDVTIKSGSTVSTAVQYYIAERQRQFPGVQVSRVYVTHYPRTTLAAQVLGTVGRITQSELKQRAYRGISRNAIIGQSGLEGQYNSFLQGKDGYQQVQINSLGEPVGNLRTQNPTAGHDLKLSLDANLQRVGQNALAQSISQNAGAGGAFVAMNPQNGEVYGMGSMPTYDPSVFTGNLAQSTYNQLTSVQADHRHSRAAERRMVDQPDLRRHRSVLRGQRRSPAVPSQLGPRGRRFAGSRQCAEGLLRRLLLQPGRPDEPQRSGRPSQRRAAGPVGAPVRDRSLPRHRLAQCRVRHAAQSEVASGS
jgi:penicillin-binding protein 2